MVQFFKTKKVSPSTTCITDITDVHCYLVEGSKKAMLIDTMTGVGNLKEFAESLTRLPISVILTHGHCDHAGGAAPFEEVYLNEADYELVKEHASMEMKKEYVKVTTGDLFDQITDRDFCPVRTGAYLPLEDGQIFDLGGITLKAVAVPGHTKGMTCILNIEERSILFGDACSQAVLVWAEESTSVEEYKSGLLNLKRHEAEYDTVYLSHRDRTTGKDILDNVIQVCNDILTESDDAMPAPFTDREGLLFAKNVDENFVRTDGKVGNIIYVKEKVRRKA